jgi:D-glycero-beta-D-manno-heptose 1-phosphate adenylyltransferase
MTRTAEKIRSLAEAVAWRSRQAHPLVFTNGVFDLLHPGHIELLERARSEGSALVVGVNSDASARRLAKGPGRPAASESSRTRVLAGLTAVDCVVLFDDDTPLALIEALSPDVLVKGADYARDHIVGADWVEARGGRVVQVPLVPGLSTSAIVERLRAPS